MSLMIFIFYSEIVLMIFFVIQ